MVPDPVRREFRRSLGQVADRIGWSSLSALDKARHYDNWTTDPAIGGVLERYMPRTKVRVYLKDTILKHYSRRERAETIRPFRILGLPPDARTLEIYEKPHGRRMEDGRIVCWGRAEDWKTVLMALHERAHMTVGSVPFAAILTNAAGRFGDGQIRSIVEDAAKKLCVERLVWTET